MQELTGLLPGCKKTFSRDIALLKKAGVGVRYSVKRQAFVLTDNEHGIPEFSESKSETRFMKKIICLTIFMDAVPDEDCDIWYQTIIGAPKRTMQRDFAILNSIGYIIKYEREAWNMHDVGTDLPPNHYYCDRPDSAYSLTTFKSE